MSRQLLQVTGQCLVTTLRTKIHPVPSRMEYIQGTSAIGRQVNNVPERIEIEVGKSYAWCACGKSRRQPWCDGAHKKLNEKLKEGEARFGPLRFIGEEARPALICMCKHSGNRPFCDGSHAKEANLELPRDRGNIKDPNVIEPKKKLEKKEEANENKATLTSE